MRHSMLILSVLSLYSSYSAAQKQPNIILIMADDLGWGDVGFNGNKQIQTPCLDRLSTQGMIFDRFYSGCSVSSPTRASVLTGRNPFRTGVFHANVGILRPEEVTLPELLQQQGYMTGHFGKWHLGTLTCQEKDANRGREGDTRLYNIPMEHGYTESFVTESKVPTFDPMRQPIKNNGRFWNYLSDAEEDKPYGTYYWKHTGEKETENVSGDDSRIIMDRVLPFIRRSQILNRPFFSAIWFHTPHLPCVAGPEYMAMYADLSLEERNYYGCITAMDQQIGRLVAFLKENNLYDNTIICFCSDNGPEVGTPGSASFLRGSKRDLYEGGIRVPAFVVWPSKIQAGQRTQHIAFTSDYLPTFAELLKLPPPPYQLDGESLISFFKEDSERKSPLVFAVQQQGAVIEQQYKLCYINGVYELYDIRLDPSEKRNMAILYPEIVSRLRKTLDQSLLDYEASFKGCEYGTTSVVRMEQKWHDIKSDK